MTHQKPAKKYSSTIKHYENRSSWKSNFPQIHLKSALHFWPVDDFDGKLWRWNFLFFAKNLSWKLTGPDGWWKFSVSHLIGIVCFLFRHLGFRSGKRLKNLFNFHSSMIHKLMSSCFDSRPITGLTELQINFYLKILIFDINFLFFHESRSSRKSSQIPSHSHLIHLQKARPCTIICIIKKEEHILHIFRE